MDFRINPNPTPDSLVPGLVVGYKPPPDEYTSEYLLVVSEPEKLAGQTPFNPSALAKMNERELAEHGIRQIRFTDDNVSADQWKRAKDSFLGRDPELATGSILASRNL